MIDTSFSTDLSCIKNIVVAPCGIAGIAYAGAINELEEQKALTHLEKVVGVSSGAYSAWIVALGYRGEALNKILADKKFTDFAAVNSKRELAKMLRGETLAKGGVFTGLELRRWAQALTAQRLGAPDLTYSELSLYRERAAAEDIDFFRKRVENALERRKGIAKAIGQPTIAYDFELSDKLREGLQHKQFIDECAHRLMAIAGQVKDFTTVAAEVINSKEKVNLENRYQQKVFSAYETPSISIAHSIRLSASYPFHFRNGYVEKYGVRKHYTDGGLINPLPVELLDKDGKHNPHTLVLDTHKSEAELVPESERVPAWMKWIDKRVRKHFGIELVKRVEDHIDALFTQKRAMAKNATISIDKGNIEATNFHIPKASQTKLIDNGRAAVQEAIALYLKDAHNAEKWENRNSPVSVIGRWVKEAGAAAQGFAR